MEVTGVFAAEPKTDVNGVVVAEPLVATASTRPKLKVGDDVVEADELELLPPKLKEGTEAELLSGAAKETPVADTNGEEIEAVLVVAAVEQVVDVDDGKLPPAQTVNKGVVEFVVWAAAMPELPKEKTADPAVDVVPSL